MRVCTRGQLAGVATCVLMLGAVAQARQTGALGSPFSASRAAGGFVFVSGTAGTDSAGQVVSGGIRSQTQQALSNIQGTLNTEGLDLSSVASVTIYIRNRNHLAVVDAVLIETWRQEGPARTTVIVPLPAAEELIRVAAIAVSRGGERRAINPPGLPSRSGGSSYAIKSGSTLFTSGLSAVAGRGARRSNVASETSAILEALKAILRVVEMSVGDVVLARPFLAHAEDNGGMNAVWPSAFAPRYPPRQTVEAELPDASARLEAAFIAMASNDREIVNDPADPMFPGQGPGRNVSPAIRVGNRLYVMGVQAGNDFLASPRGRADLRGQTRVAVQRLEHVLRRGGFQLTDVVDVVVCLPDITRMEEVHEILRAAFVSTRPAGSTVGIRLTNPNAGLEIHATAIK